MGSRRGVPGKGAACPVNIVVRTNGEWQAFDLVMEMLRQKKPSDRLLVWDDNSPEHWLEQMRDLAEVKQHRVTDSMGDHFNLSVNQFPDSEWVVSVDADERVQPGFLDAIKARTDLESDADAMWLERRNSYWEDTGTVLPTPIDYSNHFDPDFQARVLRNNGVVHLENPIHEILVGAKRMVYLTGPPFTLIHHRKNCPRAYERLVPNYADHLKGLCNPPK